MPIFELNLFYLPSFFCLPRSVCACFRLPPTSQARPGEEQTHSNPQNKGLICAPLACTMRTGLQASHNFISADLHVQRELLLFSASSGFTETNDKTDDQRGSESTLGFIKLPSRDMESSLLYRQCKAMTTARLEILV